MRCASRSSPTPRPRSTLIARRSSRDLEMSISVRVNARFESQDSGAANFTLPAGASTALRWDQSGNAEHADQGHALMLFGRWTRGEHTRWTPTHHPNTAAHAISVYVIADPKRIGPTLQAIDFTSLSTALAKSADREPVRDYWIGLSQVPIFVPESLIVMLMPSALAVIAPV